jgi:hypothetical protein
MLVFALLRMFVNQEILEKEDNNEIKFLEDDLILSTQQKKITLPFINPNMIVPSFTGRKGYISYTGEFSRKECFKPTKSVAGKATMRANSFSHSTSKSLMSEITGGFSIGVNILDQARIGLNLDFTKIFEESDLTASYYYYMQYTRDREIQYGITPSEVLKPGALELYQKSKLNFIKKCGNQVVSKVRESAIILIQANFHFSAAALKTGFGVGLNLKIMDLVKLSANFANYMRTKRTRGKIEFTGYQIGGDVHKFSSFFPDNSSDACASVVEPDLDLLYE